MTAAADCGELRAERARALVAPGCETALTELGVLEPRRWAALLYGIHGAGTPGGGRRGVATVRLRCGDVLVLRPFHHGGLLSPLLGDRLSSPRRLFDELRTTHELAKRGAPVPTPSFAVAHRHGPTWTGGVATLRVDDTTDALTFLRSTPSSERLALAIEAAARALRSFHDCGGRHADLHVGNLLVREGSAAGTEVTVVDLDRAEAGESATAGRRAREIARLERSLYKRRLGALARGEAARQFLAAYADGNARLSSDLRSGLRRERLRTAAHRLGYSLQA